MSTRARVFVVAAVTAVAGALGAGSSAATPPDPFFELVSCPDCLDPCLRDPQGKEVVCIPMQWPPV